MATPNTNILLQPMANGVRNVKTGQFYPYKVSAVTVTGRTNRRFYLRDVVLGYHRTGIQAADTAAVTVTLDNVSVVVGSLAGSQMTQAADFQDLDLVVPVGLLLDKEKDMTVSGTPSIIKMTYAEVDDLG